MIDRKLMVQRLPELISKLNATEREIILDYYFRNVIEREMEQKLGVPRKTLCYQSEGQKTPQSVF